MTTTAHSIPSIEQRDSYSGLTNGHAAANMSSTYPTASTSQHISSPPPSYPPSTPHLNPHNLLILSHQSRGRGVYASRPLPSGTIVEISPVLLFNKSEWDNYGSKTILDCYTFKWGRMGEMALALGLGSLFNHSKFPSVAFYIDRSSHSIRYQLVRDVVAGEELCISYGPWGKQYESGMTQVTTPQGDEHAQESEESDYESRTERDLANFLKIGQDRSDSDTDSDDSTEVIVTRQSKNIRSASSHKTSEGSGNRRSRTRHNTPNGHSQVSSRTSTPNGSGQNGTSQVNSRANTPVHVTSVAGHKEPNGIRSSQTTASSSSSESSSSSSSSSSSCSGRSRSEQRYTSQPNSRTSLISEQPPSSTSNRSLPQDYIDNPIWRLTSLPDPTTVPLRLMECYALVIPARSSSLVLSFLKKQCTALGRGKSLGCEEDSIRHAKTLTSLSSIGGGSQLVGREQEKMLKALLCPVDNIKGGQEQLREMLSQAGLQGDLIHVSVADSPAPIKARSAEWSASWPVAIRSSSSNPSNPSNPSGSGSNNGSASGSGSASPLPGPNQPSSSSSPSPWSNLSSALALSSAPPKSSTFIDRRGDCQFWTSARTQWVISKLARCVLLSIDASNQGQVPVGVHVCPSILPVSPCTGNVIGGCWDRNGIPFEGGEAIEADAYDTRIQQKNPIKHAVGNVIQRVAELRAAKRISTATNADDERSGGTSCETTSTSSLPLLLNGQDYLLTSLTLFTTHEPCVYCCMSLVHSRVRTLIFLKSSKGSGGCCGSELPLSQRCDNAIDEKGGPYALQEQKGLNHRFEVWKWRSGIQAIQDEVDNLQKEGQEKVDIKKLLDLSSRFGRVDP
ncbi:unnamed protein product [Sympodiomycopsis kandeliae]